MNVLWSCSCKKGNKGRGRGGRGRKGKGAQDAALREAEQKGNEETVLEAPQEAREKGTEETALPEASCPGSASNQDGAKAPEYPDSTRSPPKKKSKPAVSWSNIL